MKIIAIDPGDARMAAAYALRHEVFVQEQGVPQELEVDDDDKIATHVLAVVDGQVVGTLRIVRHGRTATVRRVAVSASMRGKGIGSKLIKYAAEAALRAGAEDIVLEAQVAARDFYKRLGYVEEGDVFDDAGAPHVMMRKKLRARLRIV